MFRSIDIGKNAENHARLYLQENGLTYVESNYRCRYGEIDLIMRDKTTTVFVEVRYRKNTSFGSGAETVDYKKQRKILATASHYLQSHRTSTQHGCRIDVISITSSNPQSSESLKIHWIPDAIQAF